MWFFSFGINFDKVAPTFIKEVIKFVGYNFFGSGGLIFIHFKFGLIFGILYPLIIV